MGQPQSDPTYFRRRASEERAAAERAIDPRARQSHIDLAERYSLAAEKSEMEGVNGMDGDVALDPPRTMPLLSPEFRILP